MTGTYLECDFCKKHLDLEGRNYAVTQAAKDAGWIEEERRCGDAGTHFCCAEHQRCYHLSTH